MGILINTIVFQNEIRQGKTQLEACQLLKGLDITGIEVRGELFQSHTHDQELEEISQLANQMHWQLYYSIPDYLFIENQVNPKLAFYLEISDRFKLDSLKISLGAVDKITDELAGELRELLSGFTGRLTVENEPNENGHYQHVGAILEQLKFREIPLGYTFDSGNWYWVNESPTAAFEALKDYTTVLHLKNIRGRKNVLLNDGDTDWKQLLRQKPAQVLTVLEYPMTSTELHHELAEVTAVMEGNALQS